MITTQRLPPALTPLESALAMLLEGLEPIAPGELPLRQALGCVAAEMPALKALPAFDVAAIDGWAFRARDLVGASSYSPLPLAKPPVWVEAGGPLPGACDCVVDVDLVESTGPLAQVVAEAIPGQGVRRAGGDIAAGSLVARMGSPVGLLDLMIARAGGLKALTIRCPRVLLINVPATAGSNATAKLIADQTDAAGTLVISTDASKRDTGSIAEAFDTEPCDLFMTIGGTGVGRGDAAIKALAQCGSVLAHGMALRPGRTAAIGRIANVPVIALPGAPDQALAAWWTLALPVLDRLSARQNRPAVRLPLARKIASGIGVAEIALLKRHDGTWMPLACGDLSLDAIAGADAWCAVPAGSEGFAAGTPVDAYMVREQP